MCVRKFLKLSQNSFNNPMGWNILVASVFTDEENVAKIIFGLLEETLGAVAHCLRPRAVFFSGSSLKWEACWAGEI